MKALEIYIDGASKGNPGPSGVGVVICLGNQTIKNIASFIGYTTNNVAEYTALIHGLEEALILKADTVKVHTDSQLMYRQLKKEYKVKNEKIKVLYNQAAHLLSAFKQVTLVNIPREENLGADKLATKAIKDYQKKRAW